MQSPAQRLVSLDFLRGLIMVLLALESTRLWDNLFELTEGSAVQNIFLQFFHHPWHGLRFWDLIQPGFMFIAGTALALSLYKQQQLGVSWRQPFRKQLKRSAWLFFFGVLDYAVRPQGLSFELWDVLTQLSFTTLVAFLIFNWSVPKQFAVSILLLILTEVLYRFVQVPGFDQPFTDQQNFGNYVDLLLMNKINKGGWVAVNCLPTAAHTIWGAIAGKWILSRAAEANKMKWILVAGLSCLALGFALDFTTTPIIKRIATTSFVLASGGWVWLMLAACYYWIDMRNHRRNLEFFTIVGMNSMFIYLFFEIVGSRWFNGYVGAITNGLMSLASIPPSIMMVLTPLSIFGLEWGLCYFLYKRGIFFRV